MQTVSDRCNCETGERGWELRQGASGTKPTINEGSFGHTGMRKEKAYLQSVSMRCRHGYEGLGDTQEKANWVPLMEGQECQAAELQLENIEQLSTWHLFKAPISAQAMEL